MSNFLYINSTIPLENMVRLYGTTWTVYAGSLYGLLPISLLGSIINLATYLILWRKPFHSSTIFKYLRLNVLNSLILCLILMTRFVNTVYKFDFTNSYIISIYGNFIYAPFLSIFYLNGNLLDILIIIERIIKVYPIPSIIRIIKLKHFWIFLFVLSLFINIPSFFLTKPAYVDIMLNNSTLVRNYFVKETEFSITKFGKILTYLMFFIRDFITLVVKIWLNVVSIVLIKKYLSKIGLNSAAKDSVTSTSNQVSTKKAYMTTVDKNLTYIAIIMSVFSSFENLFFIASYIYIAFSLNQVGLTLYFFSNFIVAIKHISNLFILYLFNNVFREEFYKIFPFFY